MEVIFWHDERMETLTFKRINRFIAGLILATTSLAAPMEGEAPPAPPVVSAAPPQADPFVKKDAPAPPVESGPLANLVVTFEVYQLSQAEGSELIQDNATDEARHDRALELVKSGKATLDAVLCGVVRPGEQIVIEQLNLMYFPIAFDFLPEKGVAATDFGKRNVGYRVVVKGQEMLDKKGFNAALFLEHTNFGGYLDRFVRNGNTSQPYHVSLTRFDVQRVNTIPPVFPYEKTCFLGTYNPIPEDSVPSKMTKPGSPIPESKMRLVFGKVSRFQLNPATVQADPPSGLEQQFSIYSLDRESARQILSQKQEADSAFQAVQELLKTNQAKLEHLSVLRSTNGIKNNFEETAEITYSTGGAGPQFTTQDVGVGAEVKSAFIGHSSLLTLDVTKCQILNYLENLPVEGVAAYFNQSMALFEVRSITTSIHSGLGEHELLGTMSPAGDNGVPGQKDGRRVWLEFVQTTALNP